MQLDRDPAVRVTSLPCLVRSAAVREALRKKISRERIGEIGLALVNGHDVPGWKFVGRRDLDRYGHRLLVNAGLVRAPGVPDRLSLADIDAG